MTTLLVKITHKTSKFGPGWGSKSTIQNIEIIPTTKSKETLVQELWSQYFVEKEKFFFEEYIYEHNDKTFEQFQKLSLEEQVKEMKSADKEFYLDRVKIYTQLRDDWLNFKFTTYDQDKLTMPNTRKQILKAELYEEDEYVDERSDEIYNVNNGYLIYMDIGNCFIYLV